MHRGGGGSRARSRVQPPHAQPKPGLGQTRVIDFEFELGDIVLARSGSDGTKMPVEFIHVYMCAKIIRRIVGDRDMYIMTNFLRPHASLMCVVLRKVINESALPNQSVVVLNPPRAIVLRPKPGSELHKHRQQAADNAFQDGQNHTKYDLKLPGLFKSCNRYEQPSSPGTPTFCSAAAVYAWQRAMGEKVARDYMPLRGSACTPTNLFYYAKKFKTAWDIIDIQTLEWIVPFGMGFEFLKHEKQGINKGLDDRAFRFYAVHTGKDGKPVTEPLPPVTVPEATPGSKSGSKSKLYNLCFASENYAINHNVDYFCVVVKNICVSSNHPDFSPRDIQVQLQLERLKLPPFPRISARVPAPAPARISARNRTPTEYTGASTVARSSQTSLTVTPQSPPPQANARVSDPRDSRDSRDSRDPRDPRDSRDSRPARPA